METYKGVKGYSAKLSISSQLHATAALLPEKDLPLPIWLEAWNWSGSSA